MRWKDATIVNILQETPNTRRYWVQVHSEDPFDFKPGQFVTLDLPVGEKRLDRWRSYSIASNTNTQNIIELCVVRLIDGKGTTYLFGLEEGGALKLKGPAGVFCLPEQKTENPEGKTIVMICTGTGVAPFRAMIQEYIDKTPNNIHLIFGTRIKEDILYYEEFKKLQDTHENFKYSVALSRADEEGFYNGYVHQIYEEHYSKVNHKTSFYICGWSNMVDEAVKNLDDLGYDKKQVHYELYG